MKLKVSRVLADGKYTVSFQPEDFTADERQGFQAFGVPTVQLFWRNPNSNQIVNAPVPVTALANFPWTFSNENEARSYETRVVAEIKDKMAKLREQKDDFTSTEDVSL